MHAVQSELAGNWPAIMRNVPPVTIIFTCSLRHYGCNAWCECVCVCQERGFDIVLLAL